MEFEKNQHVGWGTNVLKFGTKVVFSHRFKRRKRVNQKVNGKFFRNFNKWESVYKPGSGLFLGYRTLRNGSLDLYIDCCVFKPVEVIRVALISPGLIENPIYAPLDTVELDKSTKTDSKLSG